MRSTRAKRSSEQTLEQVRSKKEEVVFVSVSVSVCEKLRVEISRLLACTYTYNNFFFQVL